MERIIEMIHKKENMLLAEKLVEYHKLSKDEYIALLQGYDEEVFEYLRSKAVELRKKWYGNKVYLRGLIEFTNYCKNNCYYCGIRAENACAQRYRLSLEDIMSCCEQGYRLGYRTFVLQGGEDPFYDDNLMVEIIKSIKSTYSDCAITISLGERSYESYKLLKEAGADRYLLRHETANAEHYNKLHPSSMSLQNRKQCLYQLKELGYQVGAGFMVGSPYQTYETLADDLIFMSDLQPEMIGIGPYLPHGDTPFASMPKGSFEFTLYLLSILRIMFPNILLPATTALGTIHPKGREAGIEAGANVVMPNLSPVTVRKKYELYDNKICTGDEAAECRKCLDNRIKSIGYEIVEERGDYIPIV